VNGYFDIAEIIEDAAAGMAGFWRLRNSLGRGPSLPGRVRAFRVVTIEAANGGTGGLQDVSVLERLSREMARGHA
jgi:hypothetical protein